MHSSPKSLIFRYLAVALAPLFLTAALRAETPPPYYATFNPADGFKPAQRNFQAIFLQMAGSFEYSGSPESYFRHVIRESQRVEAAYSKATGKKWDSRPAYFTEEYVEGLIRGWDQMAPTLALESLCRKSGVLMRYAVLGSWSMNAAEIVASETKLTPEESASYRTIIDKPYFAKPDLPAVEAFYASAAYEKLTDFGKGQLSKRTWRGTLDSAKRAESFEADKDGTIILGILRQHQKESLAAIEDTASPAANGDTLKKTLIQRLRLNDDGADFSKLPEGERDALVYSHMIKTALDYRLGEIRKQADPATIKEVEKAINLILENLLVAAQCEYETGLISDYLKNKN